MANTEEIARRTKVALAAIKQSVGKAEFSVDLFVSHHIEEIDSTYWQQHTGTARPTPEQVLGLLKLRSHWDAEGDGIDVFDFTLPRGVTDYVISVRFDDDGAVEDISMESYRQPHSQHVLRTVACRVGRHRALHVIPPRQSCSLFQKPATYFRFVVKSFPWRLPRSSEDSG